MNTQAQDTITASHKIKVNTNKLDTKVMNMMLSSIISQVESTNLYKEEQ
jgi:hypothetical protein